MFQKARVACLLLVQLEEKELDLDPDGAALGLNEHRHGYSERLNYVLHCLQHGYQEVMSSVTLSLLPFSMSASMLSKSGLWLIA